MYKAASISLMRTMPVRSYQSYDLWYEYVNKLLRYTITLPSLKVFSPWTLGKRSIIHRGGKHRYYM